MILNGVSKISEFPKRSNKTLEEIEKEILEAQKKSDLLIEWENPDTIHSDDD